MCTMQSIVFLRSTILCLFNRQITVFELTTYAEQHGIEVRKMFRGFAGREINSVGEYFDSVMETMLLNMKRIFMRVSEF